MCVCKSLHISLQINIFRCDEFGRARTDEGLRIVCNPGNFLTVS
jgi:hypothetical protein